MLPSLEQLTLRVEPSQGSGRGRREQAVGRDYQKLKEEIDAFDKFYLERAKFPSAYHHDQAVALSHMKRQKQLGPSAPPVHTHADLNKWIKAQLDALDGPDPAFALEGLNKLFYGLRNHQTVVAEALTIFRNEGGPARLVGCLDAARFGEEVRKVASQLLWALCRNQFFYHLKGDSVMLWEVMFCRPDVTDLIVGTIAHSTREGEWQTVAVSAQVLQMFLNGGAKFYVPGIGPTPDRENLRLGLESWKQAQWRSPLTGRTSYETRVWLFDDQKGPDDGPPSPHWRPPGNDGDPKWFYNVRGALPSFYFQVRVQEARGVEALVGALQAAHRHVMETEKPLNPVYAAMHDVAEALAELLRYVNISYQKWNWFSDPSFLDESSSSNSNSADDEGPRGYYTDMLEVPAFHGEIQELLGRSFRWASGPRILPAIALMDKTLDEKHGTRDASEHRRVVLDALLALFPKDVTLQPRAIVALDILDAGFVSEAVYFLKPNANGQYNRTLTEVKILQLLRRMADVTDKVKMLMGEERTESATGNAHSSAIYRLKYRLPDPKDLTECVLASGKLMLAWAPPDQNFPVERERVPKDLNDTITLLASLATYPANLPKMRTNQVHHRTVNLLKGISRVTDWDQSADALLVKLLAVDEMRNDVVAMEPRALMLLLKKYTADTATMYLYEHSMPLLKSLCGHGKAYNLVASNYVVASRTRPKDAPPTQPRTTSAVTTPRNGEWVATPGAVIADRDKPAWKMIVREVLANEDVLMSAAVYNPEPSFQAALRLLQLITKDLEMDADRVSWFPTHTSEPAEFTEEQMKQVERRKKWEAMLPRLQSLYAKNPLWHTTIDDACDRAAALLGAGEGRGNVLYEYEARNWPERGDLPPAVKRQNVSTGTHSAADIVAYVQLHKAWMPGYCA